MKKIVDPLEVSIRNVLIKNNIKFIHEKLLEDTDVRLDFYLPDHDIYLEVKRYILKGLTGS